MKGAAYMKELLLWTVPKKYYLSDFSAQYKNY